MCRKVITVNSAAANSHMWYRLVRCCVQKLTQVRVQVVDNEIELRSFMYGHQNELDMSSKVGLLYPQVIARKQICSHYSCFLSSRHKDASLHHPVPSEFISVCQKNYWFILDNFETP